MMNKKLMTALTSSALLVTACGDRVATSPTGDIGSSTTITVMETTTPITNPATLPGEAIDLFAADGDIFAVVGIAHDDVLNVRELPGTDQPVATTAESTANNLIATGRAQNLPESIWYEMTVTNGKVETTGWVDIRSVAFIGVTDDATAQYLAENPAPSAETMTDLGLIVADHFASEDPPSSIVQSESPTVGDLGEVTYDVIGLGDDALSGWRLRIFATVNDTSEGFTLRTIERTALCTRGVIAGLCT